MEWGRFSTQTMKAFKLKKDSLQDIRRDISVSFFL